MAQVSKLKLSGSTDGRQIKITTTATPGTLIHTATTSTTPGTYDEIWIYLVNIDAVDRSVTIEWGGTTSPDDRLFIPVPAAGGRVLAIDGGILQNGAIVRAFCPLAANVCMASGFVNRIQA